MPDDLGSVEGFREEFPAFTKDLFPDRAVELRLRISRKFFHPSKWKDPEIREHALYLYCAHYLTIMGSAMSGGGGLDQPMNNGPIASMSADDVSVSYDTTSTTVTGAGFYNSTAFGKELWSLMRMYSPGIFYVI